MTNITRSSNVENALTLALAGTIAALVVGAARGSRRSPLGGLLSNPVPRRQVSSPATRSTLGRAA
jgi:hypothetical protein